MIFLGDIAHPFSTAPDWSAFQKAITPQPAVVNLEGAITDTTGLTAKHKLFNHPSVLDALKAIDVQVAGLANNHMCDVANGPSATRSALRCAGIASVGAGENIHEASAPANLTLGGRTYLFIAFGWKTIGCKAAGARRSGTQPLDPRRLLTRIRELRAEHPTAILVPLIHWNFELEPHPQPAHRQLAFAAIESGADVVIGHHPHCVGGFEYYNGHLIAYSLGNWWLPHDVFFNGRLRFPDYTLAQVALEWHPDRLAQLHWFQYRREGHTIEYRRSHSLTPAMDLSELTPYAGASTQAYTAWFRRNRLKRKALPVYTDSSARWLNALNDVYVRGRHPLVVGLNKLFGRL